MTSVTIVNVLAALAALQCVLALPLEKPLQPEYAQVEDLNELGELKATDLEAFLKKVQNPWERSGKFEGDIVLDAGQRNGLINPALHWHKVNGFVDLPYEIVSHQFTADQIAAIHRGFDEFHQRTCIRLRPRTASDIDYVRVQGLNSGCWSMVGRRGRAALELVQSDLAPRLCHRQRWNWSKVTLLLVSVIDSAGTALELVQSDLAPRLCHRQRWNWSKVTLLLVSVIDSAGTALELVQSDLAPRLCHRQRWNWSKVTLLLVSIIGSAVTGPEQPCSFMLLKYLGAAVHWKESGYFVQDLNLQPGVPGSGCFRHGTIVHEFLHALGFYHEQSSSDRDDYVTIVWANIQAGTENNFAKHSASTVTNYGIGYDYDSVLHYGPFAFSVNGEMTIVPHDPTAVLGQRVAMSEKDVLKLNTMYQCNRWFAEDRDQDKIKDERCTCCLILTKTTISHNHIISSKTSYHSVHTEGAKQEKEGIIYQQ
uniref:Peptidase M12A domain-containing protein n=1 Tax=Timema tahoe TaxID=61484 RepID=A0A7R9IJU7_9NEOP|nr:unnamed protein product [Timema tahoe]